MNRMQFLKEEVGRYAYGEPIQVAWLQVEVRKKFALPPEHEARATAVCMKRLMDTGCVEGLRRYEKGIYYRAEPTPFGESHVDRNRLIALKYTDQHQGYEGGLSALHQVGLTSQMPNERVIVTNKAKAGTRQDRKLNITIRKPATRITADNIQYLQLLDMLDGLDRAPVDAEQPVRILKAYVAKHKLRWETLLAIAGRHYGTRTIGWVVRLTKEGEAPLPQICRIIS